MGIYTRWQDDQQTILYTEFGEVWTWTEVHAHSQNIMLPMIQSARQPVAKISDLSRTLWHTTGSFLDNFKQGLAVYRDEPIDATIFIVHNASVKSAMETILYQHGAPHRLYAFPENLKEALRIINNYRRSNTANV